ncbi:hypothetical protein ACO2Q8_01465 [Larkinella sp. VNQ87]|uniref:hypothetical protein n=1 Tax=Larkinella sp. VNQ87 TaxID=3400921 RepID=UPI003C0753BF
MRRIEFGVAMLLMGIMGCQTGLRDFDLASKQFEVSYNVDSTQGLDSARLAVLVNTKAIYSFTKGGEGIVHTQLGMVSRDTIFQWKVQGDSLLINQDKYAVEKQVKGFKLKSNSAMLILRQQP